MEVYITELDDGYTIQDGYGNFVCAFIFGDYVKAEDYAIEQGYILCEYEV
jgi:hypothetical protein